MPKASKPKPATKPKPPVLSSAEKALQRANTAAYKNAKVSTLASAAPRKGPRFHDADADDDADSDDSDDSDNSDDSNNGDNGDNGNADDDADGNARDDDVHDGDDGDRIDRQQRIVTAPKAEPYKSRCGNYIYIPNEAGEYNKYKMLDRPEGDLKKLDELMKLGGPDNKTLFKGIQAHVRTIVRHVARNIPKCTYVKLNDEQRASINAQVYTTYPIMRHYRDNWAVKEMVIRALTHQRDHQARIEKAGGQVAWCNKLKAQREAKKVGNVGTIKGKANQPHRSTVPEDQSDDSDPAPTRSRPKPRPRPTRVEDSEEEASNEDPPPAPGPSSSGQTTKNKTSNRAPKATSDEASDDEPAPVLKPSSSKSKGKAVARERARRDVEDLSNDGKPAALERLVTKRKAKAAQKSKAQEQLVEDDSEPDPAPAKSQGNETKESENVPTEEIDKESEPGTTSRSEKRKNKRTEEIHSPVSPTVVSSTPPRPAEVGEPASPETGLEEATQEYPSTIASSTPAPAVVPRLGSDSLEAGTREHGTGSDSDEDAPMFKLVLKRARPSPRPATSPPTITDSESVDAGKKRKTPSDEPTVQGKGKGANTQKGRPAKKGRTAATLAVADDEMVGSSVAAESRPAPKRKRGRQAKQELIDTTDGLLGDPTPPAPGRKTRRATNANKR
ncbi:hypothetical protein OPQ81_011149 [Rhizoctonia solani]|nr:hypothetical protein OPQ81_011149 [Rhizoctonia solani]